RPEAVDDDRRHRSRHDERRLRAQAALRLVHRDRGIERQRVALARERDAEMAGMKDRLVDDDLELAAPRHGSHCAGRLAGIAERAAARSELLRIAALVLLEPRRGLE